LSTGSIDLTVSGGIATYTFDWTGPGGFSATTEDISGLAYGNYTVTVTDFYCGIAVLSVFVDSALTTGIEENVLSVALYPNPTADLLYIKSESSLDIEVYNTIGELVLSKKNATVIDLSEQEGGSYLIKIISQDGILNRQILKF